MVATVETVRFERPAAVHFRLVRGPVPHVVERFELTEDGEDTRSSTTRASSEPTSGPWASGGETWWLGDGTKRCGRRWPRSRGSPRCGRRVAGPDGRASRVTGRSAGRSRPRRTAIAGGSSGRSGSSPTNRCSSMPSRASFASDPSTRPTGASRSNGPGSPDDADPSGGRDPPGALAG
jgi:hypothetical protein